MREFRSYGSVRGVPGNRHSYRAHSDRTFVTCYRLPPHPSLSPRKGARGFWVLIFPLGESSVWLPLTLREGGVRAAFS
jgi:hypothetical protein